MRNKDTFRDGLRAIEERRGNDGIKLRKSMYSRGRRYHGTPRETEVRRVDKVEGIVLILIHSVF